MTTEMTAAPTEKKLKYGEIKALALGFERDAAWDLAINAWESLKGVARATKRSTAEAVEGVMRCRARLGDVKATGVEAVGAILDDAIAAEGEAALRVSGAEASAAATETGTIAPEPKKPRAKKPKLDKPAQAMLDTAVAIITDEKTETKEEPMATAATATKKKPATGKKPKPVANKPKTTPAIEAHVENLARKEQIRAKQNGVKVGDKFEHSRRGVVDAHVEYHAVRDWRVTVSGKRVPSISTGENHCTSISDAANSAAKVLGQKSRELNGWVFWGIEKREE